MAFSEKLNFKREKFSKLILVQTFNRFMISVFCIFRTCPCGQTSQNGRCGTTPICENTCGHLLNCQVHSCQEKCHKGIPKKLNNKILDISSHFVVNKRTNKKIYINTFLSLVHKRLFQDPYIEFVRIFAIESI